MSNYIAELCQFLDGGISPYHTVAQSGKYLAAHGFEELSMTDDFSGIRRGGKYYISGSSQCCHKLQRDKKAAGIPRLHDRPADRQHALRYFQRLGAEDL